MRWRCILHASISELPACHHRLLPVTTVKKVSVWLMIIHQFIAWSLYVTPLLYMCEPAFALSVPGRPAVASSARAEATTMVM